MSDGRRRTAFSRRKAAYLLGAYEARYKKLLKMPAWDEEELEEMGKEIAATIRRDMRCQAEVRQRLINLELVALGAKEH